MKSTGNSKIFSGVLDFIKNTIVLVIFGMIIQVTGTTFFGVNLFPIIVAVIVVVLLISGLASDKKILNWITRKLNMLFR